jgi:hypothetical protein
MKTLSMPSHRGSWLLGNLSLASLQKSRLNATLRSRCGNHAYINHCFARRNLVNDTNMRLAFRVFSVNWTNDHSFPHHNQAYLAYSNSVAPTDHYQCNHSCLSSSLILGYLTALVEILGLYILEISLS